MEYEPSSFCDVTKRYKAAEINTDHPKKPWKKKHTQRPTHGIYIGHNFLIFSNRQAFQTLIPLPRYRVLKIMPQSMLIRRNFSDNLIDWKTKASGMKLTAGCYERRVREEKEAKESTF